MKKHRSQPRLVGTADLLLFMLVGWLERPRDRLLLLALILADAAIVAALFWFGIGRWTAWESIATALLGLAVIAYAVLCHADAVGSLLHGDIPPNEQGDRVAEQLLLLVAGTLLFVAGPVTDLLGLVLLLPVTRRRAVHILAGVRRRETPQIRVFAD